jgi:hypothetical protein
MFVVSAVTAKISISIHFETKNGGREKFRHQWNKWMSILQSEKHEKHNFQSKACEHTFEVDPFEEVQVSGRLDSIPSIAISFSHRQIHVISFSDKAEATSRTSHNFFATFRLRTDKDNDCSPAAWPFCSKSRAT